MASESFRGASDVWYSRYRNQARVDAGLRVGISVTVNSQQRWFHETSVTVNNNSPIQDYVHLDDHTQPTYEMKYYYYIFDHDWSLALV